MCLSIQVTTEPPKKTKKAPPPPPKAPVGPPPCDHTNLIGFIIEENGKYFAPSEAYGGYKCSKCMHTFMDRKTSKEEEHKGKKIVIPSGTHPAHLCPNCFYLKDDVEFICQYALCHACHGKEESNMPKAGRRRGGRE